MNLNVRELIDVLEELAQEHGDETEVRIASQPTYPLQNVIANVRAVGCDDSAPFIYIAVDQDSHEPYAPKEAWEEA